MTHASPAMLDYLSANRCRIETETLDENLEAVIAEGFLLIGKCIFLKAVYPSNYELDDVEEDEIKSQFLDFSGYEYSTNRFHVEDFTNKDGFIQAVVFCARLREVLLSNFPKDSFVIIMNFQDDSVGKFVHFTFHKKREGEVVCDFTDIESRSEPLYIEIVKRS